MVFFYEEVYIKQLEGFINPNKDMVCKLHKALYGLKQAPIAWYEMLHNYLISIGFQRTNDNNSLYTKEGPDNKIVLVEIFMDDTLFTRNDDLCKEFSEQMIILAYTSRKDQITRLCWQRYFWMILYLQGRLTYVMIFKTNEQRV